MAVQKYTPRDETSMRNRLNLVVDIDTTLPLEMALSSLDKALAMQAAFFEGGDPAVSFRVRWTVTQVIDHEIEAF